jgi:hypothetical protein
MFISKSLLLKTTLERSPGFFCSFFQLILDAGNDIISDFQEVTSVFTAVESLVRWPSSTAAARTLFGNPDDLAQLQ